MRSLFPLLFLILIQPGSALCAMSTPASPRLRERIASSEFLLGVQVGSGSRNWSHKIYGPDLSGSYGGLQGQGGLEAIKGSDAITRGIVNDWWGNVVGYVAVPGSTLTWNAWQHLAWGPAPGWGTPPQDGTKPLHELLGHRGLTVDPPGFIQHGLRYYDPDVGRWLSPDPAGHSGSLSLYDYCDNDPVNVFDPDGRFGKAVFSFAYNGFGVGQGLRAAGGGLESWAASSNNGVVAGLGGSANALFTTAGNFVTPSAYVHGYTSAVNATASVAYQSYEFGGNDWNALRSAALYAANSLTGGNSLLRATTGYDRASASDLGFADRFQNGAGFVSQIAFTGAAVARAPLKISSASVELNNPSLAAKTTANANRINGRTGCGRFHCPSGTKRI